MRLFESLRAARAVFGRRIVRARPLCVLCGEYAAPENRSWSRHYQGYIHTTCIPAIVRRRGHEAERHFLEHGPGDELTRMFTTRADAARGYRGIGSSLQG